MSNLSFRGRWPAKKGENTHINILGTGNSVDCLAKNPGSYEGEDCLPPDRQQNDSGLTIEGGRTHCWTLNGLMRKILLKCHENGVMVCQEYLKRYGKPPGRCPIQVQESSGVELGRMSKPWVIQMVGTPVVDLFASRQAHRVSPYFSLEISDRRRCWEAALKERWPKGIRYAFPPPNIIEIVLGRLIRFGGDLIMITPFWPDQTWFPEIMHLVTEPPRHFPPSLWLIWNATTKGAIPKVMKSIQLPVWKLT